MPAGELVIAPMPSPDRATVSLWRRSENVAPTAFAASSATVHAPVPEQAPLQPENSDPSAGDAVSVTAVPASYVSLHWAPQSIPAGALVTVPLPAPPFRTLKIGRAH